MNWKNYRIVKFNNGMFGIRKGYGFFGPYEFYGQGYWWFTESCIKEFCLFATQEDAEAELCKICNKESKPISNNILGHEVIK